MNRTDSLLLTLALFFPLALLACGGPAESKPNIVWVTLDTVRADQLGAYGYFRQTSPTFDALAERSYLFERPLAPMATTLPSHLSALTATYPNEHGVLANTEVGGKSFVPSDKLESLASFLNRRGYATAAFTSATPLKAWSGIQRGFEVYDATPEKTRRGDITTELATRWLSQHVRSGAGHAPFFLWVHLFDAHSPHEAPPDFDRFENDDEELTAYLEARRFPRTAKRWNGEEIVVRDDIEAYNAELLFVDAQLGRILDAIDAADLSDRTAVVVMGDHGEGIGQHDFLRHGHIWGEQLHTPLLIHVPGAPAQRVAAPISLVDVFPTLLGQIDIPGEEEFLANVSGVDVLAGPGSDRMLLSQSSARLGRFGVPLTYALTNSKLKFVSSEDGQVRLYDLVNDPHELVDLSKERPEEVERLQALLAERLDQQAARNRELGGTESRPVDRATLEELRSLGYIVEE